MKKLVFGILIILNIYSFGQEPVITWVYMKEAEPINWFDKEAGNPMGIEVEIVQYIMDKLGIKVKHKFYPWARGQMLLEKGKIDGTMTTPNDNRWNYSVFGKEMALVNYWNLFIQNENTKLIEEAKKISSLEGLKSYKMIDFIGNGWSDAFMNKSNGYNIHSVSKIKQIPQMISIGRGDMTINSSTWINWWAKKMDVEDKIIEIDCEDIKYTRFHFVFMISRRSPWFKKGIIKAMDRELKKMKENGKWYEILRKYGHPHGYGKPFETDLDTKKYYLDYENYPEYKNKISKAK